MYFQITISAWLAIKLIEYTCLSYEYSCIMLAQPSHFAVQDHHSSMHSAMPPPPVTDDSASAHVFSGFVNKIIDSAAFEDLLQKKIESTKKQIEDAAIEKLIDSAAFHEKVESSMQRVLKKQRVDNLYGKATRLLHEFVDIDPHEEEHMMLLRHKMRQVHEINKTQDWATVKQEHEDAVPRDVMKIVEDDMKNLNDQTEEPSTQAWTGRDGTCPQEQDLTSPGDPQEEDKAEEHVHQA